MKVIDTGEGLALDNMRFDSQMLGKVLEFESTLLHFYEWSEKSMTYGYFINPSDHLHVELVKEQGFAVARRTTGGGILFHGKDLTFSFLVPATHPLFSTNTLENYQRVNQGVVTALQEVFPQESGFSLLEGDFAVQDVCHRFCRAKPVRYDVLLRGKKVAGAAERRTLNGFLHQGSVSLVFEEGIESFFLRGEVWQAMQKSSTALLPSGVSEKKLSMIRGEIKKALVKSLKKIWMNC